MLVQLLANIKPDMILSAIQYCTAFPDGPWHDYHTHRVRKRGGPQFRIAGGPARSATAIAISLVITIRFEEFITAAQKGLPSPVTFQEGRENLALALALRQSAREGGRPIVPSQQSRMGAPARR